MTKKQNIVSHLMEQFLKHTYSELSPDINTINALLFQRVMYNTNNALLNIRTDSVANRINNDGRMNLDIKSAPVYGSNRSFEYE